MGVIKRVLSLCVLMAAPTIALAEFPTQPVRIVVGFPAGTGPDIISRLVAQELPKYIDQNVVVENRTGAGGQISAQYVARAKPDGHTILLSGLGLLAIAPVVFDSLGYDPLTDFTPVTEAVRTDFVLVVPNDSPHSTVQEFVSASKASDVPVNFATFGAATPGHFGAELLAMEAGFKIEPIHYRSTGDALTALVAGDVQAALITTAMASQLVAGGKIRGLATTGATRSDSFPDIPTLAESGLPQVVFGSWLGFVAPAGVPPEAIKKLQEGIAKSLHTAESKKRLDDLSFLPVGSTSEEMDKLMRNEIERAKRIVEEAGFKAS